MIATLLIGGLKHYGVIRRDSNMKERVARVINPVTNMPVKVFRELANKPNHFVDTVDGQEYALRVNGSFARV